MFGADRGVGTSGCNRPILTGRQSRKAKPVRYPSPARTISALFAAGIVIYLASTVRLVVSKPRREAVWISGEKADTRRQYPRVCPFVPSLVPITTYRARCFRS